MEPQIQMAVCDDLAAERQKIHHLLADYCDQNSLLVQIDDFPSGEALLNSNSSVYGLVILDIFIGKVNGMETAKRLIAKNPSVQIIFCSTSNEFAAESYDVAALHYLTKPLEDQKFLAVLDHFFAAYQALKTITVKVQRVEENVCLSDILWVESAGHDCILHTKCSNIATRTTFSCLCSELEPFDFVKSIRYALVSLGAVTGVPSKELALCDGTEIPISPKERDHILQKFTDYKLKEMLRKVVR